MAFSYALIERLIEQHSPSYPWEYYWMLDLMDIFKESLGVHTLIPPTYGIQISPVYNKPKVSKMRKKSQWKGWQALFRPRSLTLSLSQHQGWWSVQLVTQKEIPTIEKWVRNWQIPQRLWKAVKWQCQHITERRNRHLIDQHDTSPNIWGIWHRSNWPSHLWNHLFG